jgi:LemA protein
MQKGKIGTKGLIIGVLIILAIWVFSSYNGIVTKNEAVNNTWAQIDTQLARRYDLIPNLVSTVKGVTKQEQTVFGELATARTQYTGAQTPAARTEAANQVEGALGRLLVIVENYPNLQSSAAFRDLMTQLEGSENRIAVARKDYNDAVTSLNTTIKRFPGNLVAGIFGFDARAYFVAPEAAQTVPTVDFQ